MLFTWLLFLGYLLLLFLVSLFLQLSLLLFLLLLLFLFFVLLLLVLMENVFVFDSACRAYCLVAAHISPHIFFSFITAIDDALLLTAFKVAVFLTVF